MIHIMNRKGIDIPHEINHVIVDRSSMLGNIFHMNDEGKKERYDLYEQWLNDQLMRGNAVSKLIDGIVEIYKEYGTLYLYCWCAPRQCHAESIKKAILARC